MALRGKDNAEKIWNFLRDNRLSPCGAAALMGNLYWESGLNPINLQNTFERRLGFTDAQYTAAVDAGTYTNFVHDGAGYGLAQWTYYSRKDALLQHARATRRSIGDLECQLEFLISELRENFGSLLVALQSAASVRSASDLVLVKYERPADMSESAKAKRAQTGQGYYDAFTSKPSVAAPVAATGPSTPSITLATPITTAEQLAAKAALVARQCRTLYVMGCFGAPLTGANQLRYIQHHSYNRLPERAAMIKAASADTFGFDCVCFVKGLLWGWRGDRAAVYGGSQYQSNGVPDIGTEYIIGVCKDVSTDFQRIEVGELLWLYGHVGIYIGGGLAVECTPSWSNGVQITACNRSIPGYNRRNWTKHGKLPYIRYTGVFDADPAPAAKTVDDLAREVLAGKWGVGLARKQRLTEAGYDYAAVQRRVNALLAP